MNIINRLQDATAPAWGSCVAVGLFDGLHLGHAAVIRRAVDCAGNMGLTPGVFTFTMEGLTPASKTGATRLLSEKMGFHIMEGLGVENVLRPAFGDFKELSPEEFVRDILYKLLNVKYIYCGQNFRFGKRAAAQAADLQAISQQYGILAEIVPVVTLNGQPVSSTRIRGCIAGGDIAAANELLGRPFAIDFPVIHGNRIGRTLDYPTINQPFPDGFTMPRRGVYASVALVDGKWRGAVTNVGVKPTVGSEYVLAETYIHGFNGDLYGQTIEVRFLDFIRPEKKFDSLEQLRACIRADAEQAEAITAGYRT